MKVFISHSWHNKMKAQKLYNALKTFGADPWMDAEQILPGQKINARIEQDMADAGLVLLVWSEQSAASAAVHEEMRLASKFDKTILPFLIDKTPIPPHSALFGLKYIDGTGDWEVAEGRLKYIVLHHMMTYFNMDETEMAKTMKGFQASIETVGQLTSRYDLKEKGTEEEKDFWEQEVKKNLAEADDKGKAELAIGAETQAFLREVMAELELAGNSKAKNQAVWEKVKAYKYADHPTMRVMTAQIKKVVDAATGEDIPPPPGAEKTPPPPAGRDAVMEQIILRYRAEITDKLVSSYPAFKQQFGPLLPDFVFRPMYEQNAYFYSRSVEHLEMLYQVSRRPGTHAMVQDALAELCGYLSNPAGILHNDQFGILGYTDDAYLVTWVLEGLARLGHVDYSGWGTDWQRINTASAAILGLYGPQVKMQLDASLENLFSALIAKHHPAQTAAPTNLDEARERLQREKEALFQSRIQGLMNEL